MFLPKNTTSIAQPLDLGIIKNIKHHYRNKIIVKKIDHIENKQAGELNINILDAINLVNMSFTQVTNQTIKNCFRKSGLVNFEDEGLEEEEQSLENDWQRLKEITNDVEGSFEDYLNIDENLQATEIASNEKLINMFAPQANVVLSDDDDDTESSNENPAVTFHDAFKGLSNVRTFLLSKEGIDAELFYQLDEFEAKLAAFKLNEDVQSRITDYFPPNKQ